MFTKICIRCGKPYHLDADEIRDGVYHPLCDCCLKEHSEHTDEPAVPERVIGELN